MASAPQDGYTKNNTKLSGIFCHDLQSWKDNMRWTSQLEKRMEIPLARSCLSAVTLDVSLVCARSWTTLSNRPEDAKDNLHTAITSHHTPNQTPMAPLLRSLIAQFPSCTQSIHCIGTHTNTHIHELGGILRTGCTVCPIVQTCPASTNHTHAFGCEKAYEAFGRSESTLEKEEEESLSETTFKKGHPVMMHKSAFKQGI